MQETVLRGCGVQVAMQETLQEALPRNRFVKDAMSEHVKETPQEPMQATR